MGVHMLKILKIMAVAAIFSLPTLGYGYKYCVDYPRSQCWSCHTSTYYPYAKVCHPINYYYGGDSGELITIIPIIIIIRDLLDMVMDIMVVIITEMAGTVAIMVPVKAVIMDQMIIIMAAAKV